MHVSAFHFFHLLDGGEQCDEVCVAILISVILGVLVGAILGAVGVIIAVCACQKKSVQEEQITVEEQQIATVQERELKL